MKFCRVVFDIRKRTNQQTDRHTDKLIAIFRTPTGGELMIVHVSDFALFINHLSGPVKQSISRVCVSMSVRTLINF